MMICNGRNLNKYSKVGEKTIAYKCGARVLKCPRCGIRGCMEEGCSSQEFDSNRRCMRCNEYGQMAD